jgi:hypothetical protein
MYFLFNTFSKGGDKHLMCHPFEHLLHKIMVFPPLPCLNNMHGKPQDITATIGSTCPSMLGKWHGAQFFTWSFQTFQSWIFKIKALDDNITLIFETIFPHMTSNIARIVCCNPLVHIGAFLGDIHIFKWTHISSYCNVGLWPNFQGPLAWFV